MRVVPANSKNCLILKKPTRVIKNKQDQVGVMISRRRLSCSAVTQGGLKNYCRYKLSPITWVSFFFYIRLLYTWSSSFPTSIYIHALVNIFQSALRNCTAAQPTSRNHYSHLVLFVFNTLSLSISLWGFFVFKSKMMLKTCFE